MNSTRSGVSWDLRRNLLQQDGTGVNDRNGIKDVGLFQKATPKKRTEKR